MLVRYAGWGKGTTGHTLGHNGAHTGSGKGRISFHCLPPLRRLHGLEARVTGRALRQDRLDDLPGDIRQPIVPPLEAVGQAFVVEAEEVEDGGLEVVDVDGV